MPYTAKRGEGQGPPDTAALRHEPPFPRLGSGAGARGPFLVSGWTRSYSVPRRLPKLPIPHPIHLPGPIGSGLGYPFPSHLRLSLSHPVLTSLPFLICLSFLCPVVSSPSDLPYFVQSPCLSRLPLPTTHSPGQVPLEGPDSLLFLPLSQNKSPHEQNPKPSPPPYWSRDPPSQQN